MCQCYLVDDCGRTCGDCQEVLVPVDLQMQQHYLKITIAKSQTWRWAAHEIYRATLQKQQRDVSPLLRAEKQQQVVNLTLPATVTVARYLWTPANEGALVLGARFAHSKWIHSWTPGPDQWPLVSVSVLRWQPKESDVRWTEGRRLVAVLRDDVTGIREMQLRLVFVVRGYSGRTSGPGWWV